MGLGRNTDAGTTSGAWANAGSSAISAGAVRGTQVSLSFARMAGLRAKRGPEVQSRSKRWGAPRGSRVPARPEGLQPLDGSPRFGRHGTMKLPLLATDTRCLPRRRPLRRCLRRRRDDDLVNRHHARLARINAEALENGKERLTEL